MRSAARLQILPQRFGCIMVQGAIGYRLERFHGFASRVFSGMGKRR